MPTIHLRADLNAEDDEGRWWSLLRDAVDPGAVVPGAVLIAGTDRFWSVVLRSPPQAWSSAEITAVLECPRQSVGRPKKRMGARDTSRR
jgi:hypothetical protein